MDDNDGNDMEDCVFVVVRSRLVVVVVLGFLVVVVVVVEVVVVRGLRVFLVVVGCGVTVCASLAHTHTYKDSLLQSRSAFFAFVCV